MAKDQFDNRYECHEVASSCIRAHRNLAFIAIPS
jgi:hypothetical protein